jgi:hypothetical protein
MSWELRRRRARVPAVLAVALGLGLVWAPSAHAAATVQATGWWWRSNTATLPLDVPKRPDVGDDQLLVEGEPEGATAVAAVRFQVPKGETSPILTVTPTQDSTVPDDAVVLACRASSSWEAAKGGKWESQPIPDCFSSVQGIKGADGKLVFALTPIQSDDIVDVVLVPGTVAGRPDNAKGSVFTLKFVAPTAADIKTTAGAEGGFTTTGGDFSSPDPSSFGAGSTSSDTGSSSFDSGAALAPSSSSFDSGSAGTDFSSPAFSQPSTFSSPSTVAPAVASAGVAAAPVAAAPVQATVASNTSEAKRGRTLGIIVLLAGAALAFWAYSGSVSGAMSGLAGGGTVAGAGSPPAADQPVIGGLGRFARPRQGPPPPLG